MNSAAHVNGAGMLDSGTVTAATLSVWREMIPILTISETPDPEWRAADENGHVHGYSSAGNTYPTLQWVWLEVPNEAAEFPGRGEYRCRACNTVVVPGSKAPETRYEPGMQDWSATLHYAPDTLPQGIELGQFRTVWFSAQGSPTRFGLGMVYEIMTDDEGVAVVLRGSGELGKAVTR